MRGGGGGRPNIDRDDAAHLAWWSLADGAGQHSDQIRV